MSFICLKWIHCLQATYICFQFELKLFDLSSTSFLRLIISASLHPSFIACMSHVPVKEEIEPSGKRKSNWENQVTTE